MPVCGDCCRFYKCYYTAPLQMLNEDHEICERYEDSIEHPKRYIHNGVECFDMLEAMLSRREVIGFYKGCILKYLWRENDKGGMNDLQKAEQYSKRLNQFYGKLVEPGDVPQDASTECAVDTD